MIPILMPVSFFRPLVMLAGSHIMSMRGNISFNDFFYLHPLGSNIVILAFPVSLHGSRFTWKALIVPKSDVLVLVLPWDDCLTVGGPSDIIVSRSARAATAIMKDTAVVICHC
jgi:hypothetical protein